MYNEIKDLFEELEPIQSLEFICTMLDLLLQEIGYNLDTDKDKKNYNTLTTCLLSMKEILESESDK